MEVLIPSFSLQLLVENAVRHGLQSSASSGHLRLAVCTAGNSLEMTVSDDGQGVPSNEIDQTFFPERPTLRALSLLRRRLQTLFGRSSFVEVRSEIGQGTTVTMLIPLRSLSQLSSEFLKRSEGSPARSAMRLITAFRYWCILEIVWSTIPTLKPEKLGQRSPPGGYRPEQPQSARLAASLTVRSDC